MQKKIILIALAFSVLLVSPLIAYALNELTISKISASIAQDLVASQYVGGSINALYSLGGSGASIIVYKHNVTTGALITSYNIDSIFGLSGAYTAVDMWCSTAQCYIADSQTGFPANSGTVSKLILSTGTSGGNFNVPVAFGEIHAITGFDFYNDGVTAVNFFVASRTDATSFDSILQVDGITLLQADNTSSLGIAITDLEWSKKGSSDNDIWFTGSNIVGNWDLSTDVITTTTQSLTIPRNIETDYDNNNIWVTDGTSLKNLSKDGFRHTNKDIGSNMTGLTTLRAPFIVSARQIMVLQEQGSQARVSVMPYVSGVLSNRTAIYDVFPSTSQIVSAGSDFSARDTSKIFIMLGGADRKVLVGTFQGVTSGISCQIDTNGDGIADYTFTDTNADGLCDLPNNVSSLIFTGTTGSNITNTASIFGCGVGFSSCTNFDTRTNGVGYLLVALLFIFFFALVMGITMKTHHSINEIPKELILFLGLIATGIGWQANWTDALPFLSFILIIIGLATTRIIMHIRGSSGGA